MRALAISFALVWTGTAHADPGDLARGAAAELAEAAIMLEDANTRADRIAALTETVRAYEAGLAAMRDGLRQATVEERALRTRVEQGQAEFAKLSSLLQSLSRAPEALGLMHPGGALDSVRATMLSSALVPAVREKTARYRADLEELTALRDVQQASIRSLEDARDGIVAARAALADAISQRNDLPAPVATDEAAMQALINSTETLSAFADSLVTGAASGNFAADWLMPVRGRLVRRSGEPGPGGVAQPGWTLATVPDALLTAPTDATVRFSGVIEQVGRVMILETDPGRLVILTGFGDSFVKKRQIVSKGEPIGLMGNSGGPAQENLMETALRDGQPRSETLYIEVRQAQAPVDPSAFFRVAKE